MKYKAEIDRLLADRPWKRKECPVCGDKFGTFYNYWCDRCFQATGGSYSNEEFSGSRVYINGAWRGDGVTGAEWVILGIKQAREELGLPLGAWGADGADLWEGV